MPRSKNPLHPSAAIAALADSPAPPVPIKDASVRVVFVRDRSWLAKAIGWDGASEFAHMAQYVAPGMVIDARVGWTTVPAAELPSGVRPDERWLMDGTSWRIPPGVQYRPAIYLDKNEDAVEVEIACTASQQRSFVDGLIGQLGDAYDTRGIEGMVTDAVVDPAWHGKRHPCFCNALGIWRLQAAGIVQHLLNPPYLRTPGGALEVCLATAGARVVSARGPLVHRLSKASGFKLPKGPT